MPKQSLILPAIDLPAPEDYGFKQPEPGDLDDLRELGAGRNEDHHLAGQGVSPARGDMSEIPPPSTSTPELGGIAGRDEASVGLPARFGKYTLIRKLAMGGMAELFLAIQRSMAGFEKLIVIKRILPSMNQDRSFIDMLLHEARVAATLSHPNIVQIFDVGHVDSTYFIAMEHVHGEDLRSIVRQMKKKGVHEFPLEHAVSILSGMCAGLAYAHEKRDLDGTALNIVHRDISPQNVVVTFTGDVKIVDFGIAKSDANLAEETKSGKLKGKVPYMSPEQARGDHVDWRSDIFASGVMLFELTTGKRLFKGQSEFETLKLIVDRDYPFPSTVRAGYPPELELIVMRALSKDRALRFQSAREMQGALEEFVRGQRIPTSTIALSQFMQGLFEDKLASQKEALLQGKQLADIIALQHDRDSGELEGSMGPSATQSMPAAAHTITEGGALGKASGRLLPLMVGVLLLMLGVGGSIAYFAAHGHVDSVVAVQPVDPPAPPPAFAKGSITVSSDPPGATIWLDGDLRQELTPATIRQLPMGRTIDVKLTKDGFEQVSQPVTLSDGESGKTVNVKLQRGSVSLDVNAKPPGLALIMTLDGKPFSGALAGITSGDQHKLVVDAPGYAEQSFTFIGTPFEKKHLEVTLEKDLRTVRTPAGPSAPETPAGSGKLNVGATGGWCNVTVDGSARGATPVAGLELSAGPHKVTCTTADGKTQSATVSVPTDGTARQKFAITP